MSLSAPESRSTRPSSTSRRARQALGHDRLERPGQPDVLRRRTSSRSYFGYPQGEGEQADARRAPRRARPSCRNGTREEMERDVEAMHGYGLWATLQQDDVRRPMSVRVPADVAAAASSADASTPAEAPHPAPPARRSSLELLDAGRATGRRTTTRWPRWWASATATEAPDDPALARLLPDAYADDPEASGEFRRYTELGAARRRKRRSAADGARDPRPTAGRGVRSRAERGARPGSGAQRPPAGARRRGSTSPRTRGASWRRSTLGRRTTRGSVHARRLRLAGLPPGAPCVQARCAAGLC